MVYSKFTIDSFKKDLFFHFIFDSLHDGILIADENGIVKYVNAAYCRITGVVLENILNRRIQDARIGSKLPEVLITGKALLGIKRKVNQIEYIADINPVVYEGKLLGAISIVRDITEIEQLSAKIKDYSYKVTELKKKVREIHQAKYSLEDIIGNSGEIKRIKSKVKRIAEGIAPVLILGESGTGKELFAHSIHNASPRSDYPFVPINCAAFPPNLLLSELFGYEEGAFTGASKGGKIGLFEVANGGTLFLDEIGDMDFELQSKLLRVLETNEFIRIGGTKPIKVNVRIISATNQDLQLLIKNKKFRADLYYRVNVVSLNIPPLRNRKEDIPQLVGFYLKILNTKLKKNYSISEQSMSMLRKYNYPGNVRELLNILEFSFNTCDGQQIQPEDLPILSKMKSYYDKPNIGSLSSTIKISEKDAIINALTQFGTSVAGKNEAAKHLGISLATLYNKIKQYGI